ncbi:MAG: hypothetical protein V1798_08990 [Pseudomonadota bacterium]
MNPRVGQTTVNAQTEHEIDLLGTITHQTIDSFENRISDLEMDLHRAKRRCTWACLGLAGAVVLSSALLAAIPRKGTATHASAVSEIKTHRLILVDEAKNVRASLALNAQHQPVLELFDAREEFPRASFGLGADRGAVLSMRDSRGNPRIILGNAGAKQGLAFLDEKNRERGYVGLALDGSPKVELSDADRKGWARMMVSSTGLPVVLVGKDGSPSVGLAASEKNRKGATLFVQDADRKVRVLLGMDEKDEPAFVFLKQEGKTPAQARQGSGGTMTKVAEGAKDRRGKN